MKSSNFVVFFVLIFFTKCFSYMNWNNTLGGQLSQIILGCFLIYAVLYHKSNKYEKTFIHKICLTLCILPITGILGALLFHNQSLGESIYASQYNIAYLFFVILNMMHYKEKNLLKIFMSLGIIWCIIEIMQQITYPHYWFATRYDTIEHDIEIRNGIYRFNTAGKEFGMIMLFYSFISFVKKGSKIYLLGVLLGVAGVYLLATRQIMVASAICLIYGAFLMKKINIKTFSLIAVFALVLYNYSESLFGEFIESTNEQMTNDNIRLLSYNFYGIEYNRENPLAILLGNGDYNRNSAYGSEIMKYQESFRLWRADIGLVGMYSLYGLPYVITVIIFFIYCIKNRMLIDEYLKMYILYMLCTSIMLWHFGYNAENIILSCCIMYLIDKSICRKKQELKQYERSE